MRGITTYISEVVCSNIAFKRDTTKGVLKAHTVGLRVGRVVDRAFTKAVVSGVVPPSSEQRRVSGIMNALTRAGIHVTASQVKVTSPMRDVYTHIDGVGHDKNGNQVMIEIKCTTATLKDHKRMYHTPCRNLPTLYNGQTTHPNSEYVRHQRQVGFAAYATKQRTGVVVVSCHDGTAIYKLAAEYMESGWFTKGVSQKPPSVPKPRTALMKWPAKTMPPTFNGYKVNRIVKSQFAVLDNNCGTVVALRRAHAKLSRKEKTGIAAVLAKYPLPHYSVSPCPAKRWLLQRH